jgi:hypothetical protein
MEELLTAIDELEIVGVRPKPEALIESLQGSTSEKTLSQSDLRSLQSKGFFVTRDGQLMSNEGEMKVSTSDGIVYALRFGEVLYGSGLAVTAGTGQGEEEQSGAAENRYLFVTAAFDQSVVPEPPKPDDTTFLGKADSLLTDADRDNRDRYYKHQRWQKNVVRNRKTADDLNSRFAEWYYVIPQSSFEKLRLKRGDLLVAKS